MKNFKRIKFGNKILGVMLIFIFSLNANAIIDDTRPYELQYANEKLNILYNRIYKSLKDSEKKKLRNAQRQWIIFRDLDCKWAFRSSPLDCLIDRTDNRVRELKATLFSNIKGEYITIDG